MRQQNKLKQEKNQKEGVGKKRRVTYDEDEDEEEKFE